MDLDAIMAEMAAHWPRIRNDLTGLLQPWRLYQIAMIAAALAVAHLGARRLRPRMREWMRELDTSMARLRFLVLVERRLRGLIFVVLLWLIVLVLREVTWPSRSYLVMFWASLASAWLFVWIATRLIRNRPVRILVAWGAWAWVTLAILGLTEEAEALLDRAGYSFGEMRLSLLVVVKALVTLGVLIALARWIANIISRRIEAVDDMSPSMKVLSDKLMRAVVYVTAVVLGLEAVGFEMTNLAVLSGAIGLGIGFGLQKVVSNLVSGVILLLDKSIKPGDVISLGDTFGWISSLGARYVSVVTRDGREYLIPNEDLITGQVVNWSYSSELVRLDVHFGVSYAADPHFVRKIAVEAAATVPRVSDVPAPVCHVTGFGDSSVDFILRFWIRDPNQGLTNVRGAVFLALWDVLKENDIEIPFPRRDVTILNAPETALPD